MVFKKDKWLCSHRMQVKKGKGKEAVEKNTSVSSFQCCTRGAAAFFFTKKAFEHTLKC